MHKCAKYEVSKFNHVGRRRTIHDYTDKQRIIPNYVGLLAFMSNEPIMLCVNSSVLQLTINGLVVQMYKGLSTPLRD